LLQALEKSKSKPLPKLLTALGIKHLGPAASESLAKTFGSLDNIVAATQDQLSTIDGVGPSIAQSISNWCNEKQNMAIIAKLKKAGVDFGNLQVSQLAQTLIGKAIVVTGSVEGFTREEAEAAIKDRGGKSPGSVSTKTYCVVVGEDPGASKVTKATDLGIPIVSHRDFVSLLETGVFGVESLT
jgi:DNA ligase (NAD+)